MLLLASLQQICLTFFTRAVKVEPEDLLSKSDRHRASSKACYTASSVAGVCYWPLYCWSLAPVVTPQTDEPGSVIGPDISAISENPHRTENVPLRHC